MQNLVVLLCLMCLLSISTQAQEKNADPNLAVFQLQDLQQKQAERGGPWLPIMKGENVLTGLYTLKAGAEDRQRPHDTDEVYYVVSGHGKFVAGGEETEVKPGSILFVKAEVEHRFFDIVEDLVLVVFFDQ
ncbi:MAG: cupin domain-containing protein [Bacteroidota bacterium]